MKFFQDLLHRYEHFRGTNRGDVISYNEDGMTCVAFQCYCGKIDPSSIRKITESELLNGKYNNTGYPDSGTV